jgi:hypothetical protein
MDPLAIDAAVRALVDEYRVQCLWFLREDYYPTTDAERERVLHLVERHGSLDAFRRAAVIRSWLSQSSSDASSVS